MPLRALLVAVFAIVVAGALAPGRNSAQTVYVLQIDMYGSEQVPPVKSVGYGFVRFFFNADRTQADYTVDVKGFGTQSVLGADIHRGVAGVNGPVVKHLADGPFIVAAGHLKLSPAELQEMAAGRWYVSLKTVDHPDGEFRGQIILPAGFFPQVAAAEEPMLTPVPPVPSAIPPAVAPTFDPSFSQPLPIRPPNTGDAGLLD